MATLVRVLGDVDAAEDAVADAFERAARRWPEDGVPPNPGGWLTTTARNIAISTWRRASTHDARAAEALRRLESDRDAVPIDLGDLEVVPDDQLRLVFLCCHPALHPDAQVALTLRLLGGFTTEQIAAAFLVPTTTMAQRLVRAKRKIRDGRIAYRIPSPEELPRRLPPVLAVVLLLHTEGSQASIGPTAEIRSLATVALHLAEVLTTLLPDEPEALGLRGLLRLHESRRPARVTAEGDLVRLADQDRSTWDAALLRAGLTDVRRCLELGRPGPIQIQAAIQAVHATSSSLATTDWAQIVALYDQLLTFRDDDLVRMNRAIAVAELDGPGAGLALLDDLELDGHRHLHSARAELLDRLGRRDEATAEFDRALAHTTNEAERAHLLCRRHAVGT